MKFSDLKARSESLEEEPLPYPRSSLADPMITFAEARAAEISICCRHNGRVKTDRLPTDTEGRVFWCPIGREYWRLSKGEGGFRLAPLKYGWQ